MANKSSIIFLLVGFVFQIGSISWADDFDQQNHYTEDQLIEVMKEKFNGKLQFNTPALFADFRFRRDAMVVAVGCDTISPMFYIHKTECYKKGIALMKDDNLKFGNLIDSVCSTVHRSLPDADFHTISSYDSCMYKLKQVLSSKSEGVTTVYEVCHATEHGNDWMGLERCYRERVPYIEDSLERLPKASRYDVSAYSQLSQITLTPGLPPRSKQDRWKLDAIQASCTAVNTNKMTDEEKSWARLKNIERIKILLERGKVANKFVTNRRAGRWLITNFTMDVINNTIFDDTYEILAAKYLKLTKQMEDKTPEEFVNSFKEVEGIPYSLYDFKTYSDFRDDHCYSDGFYALALGTTVPGTVVSACLNRIPGVSWHFNPVMVKSYSDHFKKDFWLKRFQVFQTKESFMRTYLSLANWGKYIDANFNDYVDHKTACLEAGVRSFTEKELIMYAAIEEQSSHYALESIINLTYGFFWNDSIYEESLKHYHDKESESEKGKEKAYTANNNPGSELTTPAVTTELAAQLMALAAQNPNFEAYKKAVAEALNKTNLSEATKEK